METPQQEVDLEENNISSNLVKDWITKKEMHLKIGATIATEQLNLFFIPKFFDSLKEICKEFPIWSGVMNDYLGFNNQHATSAFVEGYFSDAKKNIKIGTNCLYRPDKFIKLHLMDIMGEALALSSDLTRMKMRHNQHRISLLADNFEDENRELED